MTYLVVSPAMGSPIESGIRKKFVAMSRGWAVASETTVKWEMPEERVSRSEQGNSSALLTWKDEVLQRLTTRRIWSDQKDSSLLQTLLSRGSP